MICYILLFVMCILKSNKIRFLFNCHKKNENFIHIYVKIKIIVHINKLSFGLDKFINYHN